MKPENRFLRHHLYLLEHEIIPLESNSFTETFFHTWECLRNKNISPQIRQYCLEVCEYIYQNFPDENLQSVVKYCPNAFYYYERFQLVNAPQRSTERLDDGITTNAPEVAGCYLIGETHFNPHTKEEFYNVKIGSSKNIKERLSTYRTFAPQVWEIDFIRSRNPKAKESEYHKKLKQICKGRNPRNNEWYFVDRETYLSICEQGFKYFE